MERTKQIRVGKLIDFRNMMKTKVEYYKQEAQVSKYNKEHIEVMYQEAKHILDSFDWWFEMGIYEKEGE